MPGLIFFTPIKFQLKTSLTVDFGISEQNMLVILVNTLFNMKN